MSLTQKLPDWIFYSFLGALLVIGLAVIYAI